MNSRRMPWFEGSLASEVQSSQSQLRFPRMTISRQLTFIVLGFIIGHSALFLLIFGSTYSLRSYEREDTIPLNCTIDVIHVVELTCLQACLNQTVFSLSYEVAEKPHKGRWKSAPWSENPYSAYRIGQTRPCHLALTANYDIKYLCWTLPSARTVRGLLIAVIILSILAALSLTACIFFKIYVSRHPTNPETTNILRREDDL